MIIHVFAARYLSSSPIGVINHDTNFCVLAILVVTLILIVGLFLWHVFNIHLFLPPFCVATRTQKILYVISQPCHCIGFKVLSCLYI